MSKPPAKRCPVEITLQYQIYFITLKECKEMYNIVITA